MYYLVFNQCFQQKPTGKAGQATTLVSSKKSLVFFTNGSTREGLAGAGIFCEDPEVRIASSPGIHASVFQAEIFAMTTALKAVISHTNF